MRHTTLFAVALFVMATALAAAQRIEPRADSPDVVLKAAINQELVDGNLAAAVQRYRAIVGRYRTSAPAVAAQALVRMAASYEKSGSPDAKQAYEEILRDFRDQREAAATALVRLGGARQGAPVPAVTVKSVMRGDTHGTVSLDGRFMTFTDQASGNLYIRDLRSNTNRALTQRDDYNVFLSAISRDNRFVAYQTWDGSCTGDKSGLAALCLVALEGAGVPTPKVLVASKEILEMAPMDWSPDGRTIVVRLRRADRSAQIGLVTVADGSLRILKSVDWRGPTRIFFSPSGRHVAFDLPVADTSDQRDIFVVAVDGSRGVTAVAHDSQDVVMGWTPDGVNLLFASDRGGAMGLWAQPLRDENPDGTPRLLRPNLGGAWSLGVTTSGALYFGVQNSDRDLSIATVDLTSGKEVAPVTRPAQRFFGANIAPAWSPDGKYLAYASNRGFSNDNSGQIIVIQTMSTGEVRELRPKLAYFLQLSWAPDGRSLFTGSIDVKGRTGVFRVDAMTGEASFIAEATGNSFPKTSPDGKRIYYRKSTPTDKEHSTIVERDLTSGAERTIATGALGNFNLSPDGRSIAAVKDGIGNITAGGQSVVDIRIDTGTMRELLRTGPSEVFPPWASLPWTPDGSAVLVRKRSPNELWLVPTTPGSSPRKLEIDVRTWLFAPFFPVSLHPDGRQIVFVSGSSTSEVMVLDNFLPTTTRP